MAAVTICSDFGAQKNKVCHCFPIYLPWSDGTRCHDLSFLSVELYPNFSLSSFTFIKRLFSSFSLSAIKVVSSAYLRLYRATKSQPLPEWPCMHRHRTFFACGSSAPVRVEHEGGSTAWLVGTLALPSVQGHRLPPPQELGPYHSLFWGPLVAGNQKVSLASLSQ